MIAKLERTQSTAQQNMGQTQNPHNGSNNKQQINNNNKTTTLEGTAAFATGGLNDIYWYQIFALDYIAVKTQNCLARIEAS